MTFASPHPASRRPPRPPRSGEPWTQEDYAALVRHCREGRDAHQIAEELGRSDASVADRASRMLPVEERGGPRDLSLQRLRHHLQEQDDYDWQAALVQTPPPRPVIKQLPPPVVRRGIPGLSDDDLVTLAEVLSQADPGVWHQPFRSICLEVGRQILLRGLDDQVLAQVEGHARERAQRLIDDAYTPVGLGWEPFGRGVAPQHRDPCRAWDERPQPSAEPARDLETWGDLEQR